MAGNNRLNLRMACANPKRVTRALNRAARVCNRVLRFKRHQKTNQKPIRFIDAKGNEEEVANVIWVMGGNIPKNKAEAIAKMLNRKGLLNPIKRKD